MTAVPRRLIQSNCSLQQAGLHLTFDNFRFSSANVSGTISITIDETGAPLRWVRGMMAAVPHRLLLSCYNDAAAVKV